jgi:methionine aminotransferase
MNQYAPMPGIPELREALALKYQSLYDCHCTAETNITITPGATYAIYTALATIIEPGDEVIVLEPAYDSYIPNILVQGGIPVCVPLIAPTFSVDWQKVNEAISSRTKAIVINTPHNPGAYVWTKEDMLELKKIVQSRQIYVISDEVYEHLTFDGRKHESVLAYPELFANAFVIYSFGKVFHATGWKMGYCIAPEGLSAEFRKMHQFLSFSCNTPMQYALAEYLKNPEPYLHLPDFYEAKRDFFLSLIRDLPFTVHESSRGTYFQTMGYDKISPLGDKEFAAWLTKEVGVACIPFSAFYQSGKDDHLVRFCFAKKEETLIEAANRLKKLNVFL